MSNKLTNLDQFRSWAKENAFIYPSSEIYGGVAAVYDYGPYGVLLLNNIKNAWWKSMVQMRDDVVGLDSGIFMHPKTWEASGHVSGFADILVEDKKTHKRHRADHLIEDWFKAKGETVDMDKKTAEELEEIIRENNIKSPAGNDLTKPRSFNLLVKSNLGTTDSTFTDENVTYLRGETCQGIYLNYKNIIDTTRVKLPFGIAQIGKAFRNEIVARQFVFRTREFEQMEMQFFHHPDDTEVKFDMWMKERMKWLTKVLGITPQRLRFKEHEKLIFYASAAFDIQYQFHSMGDKFDELEGIHARSDYDLTQHAKFSGQKLDYFDQSRNERYIPHIMETSIGATRTLMMILDDAWTEEEIENAKGEKDTRIVLKLKKTMAPIKIAVLPLSRKPELQEKAKTVKKIIQSDYMTEYDETGSIGKRYRRQDEIGTPYCITIDFDSLEDNAVTIRDRDSMKQDRIAISKLKNYFEKNLGD